MRSLQWLQHCWRCFNILLNSFCKWVASRQRLVFWCRVDCPIFNAPPSLRFSTQAARPGPGVVEKFHPENFCRTSTCLSLHPYILFHSPLFLKSTGMTVKTKRWVINVASITIVSSGKPPGAMKPSKAYLRSRNKFTCLDITSTLPQLDSKCSTNRNSSSIAGVHIYTSISTL